MSNESKPVSHSSYLDFELEIGPGRGREYTAAVIRSPAGEAHGTFHFPFGELELENRLQALHIALLSSSSRRRRVLSQEEQAVQDFGRELFNALIADEVRRRYDVSLREAIQQGKGLRLKLRIQSPELAALPWEFLYDVRQGEYVCLSRHTPIVRYLDLPQPIHPMTVTLPLHILGMIASPHDLVQLDIRREKQRVEEAIKGLRARGLADLNWLEGQSWHDLQRAMRRGTWHVFHFVGHGGFDRNADEGFIALADEEGQTHRLTATQLGRLLADHASLRLAFLNSCEGAQGSERDIFSSTAATLVRRGIPAVLAMQREISDGAAIQFAHAFYEALTDGMPVDAAVAEARKAISLAATNTVEWGAPVLYMRSPHGDLFDIRRKEPAIQAEQESLLPSPPVPKPTPAEPSPVLAWLRGLPALAWAGLLALLLMLGAVAVWQLGGNSTASESPASGPAAAETTEALTLTATPSDVPTTVLTMTPMPTPPPGCPSDPVVSVEFKEVWGSVREQIGCATGAASKGRIVGGDFAGGKMFWFEDGKGLWNIEEPEIDPILVLFSDDNTWRLVKYPGWEDNEPEFSCGKPEDQKCPPMPKRGFGKVWCEVETPDLNGLLGEILDPDGDGDCEQADDQGRIQRFDRGFMVHSGGETTICFYDSPEEEETGQYESKTEATVR
ncbi:MAG: CHAT domain-containing protein [Anaerolineae bacterium]|nr:MAG: CHAT domain-containing protein [Anaerolineae bacterium]